MSLSQATNIEHFKELIAERYPTHTKPITILPEVDICYFGDEWTAINTEDPADHWTNVLDRELGFTSNNFGIEGISTSEQLGLFVTASRFVKMQHAVFLLPGEKRMTAAIYNHPILRFVNVNPRYQTVLEDDPEAQEIAETWLNLPRSVMLDRVYTDIAAIQRLGDAQGINIVFATWNDIIEQVFPNNVQRGPKFSNDGQGSLGFGPGPGPNNEPGRGPGPIEHLKFAQGVIPFLKSTT